MNLDGERFLKRFMAVLLTFRAECSLVESGTHVVNSIQGSEKDLRSPWPGSHAAMRSHVLS